MVSSPLLLYCLGRGYAKIPRLMYSHPGWKGQQTPAAIDNFDEIIAKMELNGPWIYIELLYSWSHPKLTVMF